MVTPQLEAMGAIEECMLQSAFRWADNQADDEYLQPSCIQVFVFLSLPCLFALFIYLAIQRVAEFLIRPNITLREIALQTVYVACGVVSLSAWCKLFVS